MAVADTVLPPDPTPHCLSCQAHIDYADMLVMDLEIRDRRIRELERKVYRLEHEREEKKPPNKLAEETTEFLNTWDEYRRKYFEDSRKVVLAPDGARGKRYQKARKFFAHDELMACLHGVALSDFHASDKEFFEPKSFLKDDERIAKHIQRFEWAESLRKSGFKDEALIRSIVQKPVVFAREEFGSLLCVDCGHDPCRCGS